MPKSKKKTENLNNEHCVSQKTQNSCDTTSVHENSLQDYTDSASAAVVSMNNSKSDYPQRLNIEDQSLRDAFTLFDVNRDGRITETELESVLRFLGVTTTRDEVRRMIQDADMDGNGTVEFDEFLRMMRRYTNKQSVRSSDVELREAFDVFDHNHDSVLDFHEIKSTMHFLGEAVTDDEVREMIREADLDRNGLVDFEEFKKMMKLLRKREEKRRTKK